MRRGLAPSCSATGPVFHVPVWPPCTWSICRLYWTSPRISSALWNRSSGSFASARIAIPSSSGGTTSETSDGGTGMSWTCW